MAITTMDGVIGGLSNGMRCNFSKISATSEGAGTWHSLLKVAGHPTAWGSNPPTGIGENPINTATYAIPIKTPTGLNKLYIGRVQMTSSTAGTLIIYDRLWHNSGLVGNVITSQSVNSTALTRFTDGKQLEIWGEVYTAMGATGSVFTATYVDSSDTSKTATFTHPANALTAGQMFPFTPVAGAVGVKSITSIILSISTGTAGNFGLVIMKRLAEIPLPIINVATLQDAFSLGIPEISATSCLNTMIQCTTTNTGNILGSIDIIEG